MGGGVKRLDEPPAPRAGGQHFDEREFHSKLCGNRFAVRVWAVPGFEFVDSAEKFDQEAIER
jgi:hypothetical protein